MNPTRLTVQLLPSDYAFAERHLSESLRRQGRWYWPVRVITIAAAVFVLLGFIGLFTYQPPFGRLPPPQVLTSTLMLLLALALAAIAIKLQERSIAGVLFGADSELLHPFTLSQTEQGIELDLVFGKSSLPWSAIRKVELVGQHLFIHILPNHGFVVPSKSFASRAELESFARALALAQERHAA